MRTLAIVVALVSVGGCATVDGIGQDVSSAARTVEGWL